MPRGKTGTKECDKCNNHVSLFAFNRHYQSCKNKTLVTTECVFCKRVFNNKRSTSFHQNRCVVNPNRKTGSNQFTTGKQKHHTEEVKEKLRIANLNKNWSDETRRKLSIAMKKAVEKNPDVWNKRRGHVKLIEHDNVKFQGQWEYDFYVWAKNEGLNIVRPNIGFDYIYDGARKYYPDFYIINLNLYVEIKGYKTERDIAKWLWFPHPLAVVEKDGIKKIRKKQYTLELLELSRVILSGVL